MSSKSVHAPAADDDGDVPRMEVKLITFNIFIFTGSHKWSQRESMGSQSFHAPDGDGDGDGGQSNSSQAFLSPMRAAALASGIAEKDIPEAVKVTLEPGDVAFHHQVRV